MKPSITIPSAPPASIVQALQNFVKAIEDYNETGVWPDNGTLRQLADEGKEALENSPYGLIQNKQNT